MDAPPRYSQPQRLAHWIIAVIVILVLAGGMLLGILGFKGVTDTFGAPIRNLIYTYHKTFGLIILAAMVVRLALRLKHGAPPYQPPLEPWQATISGMVHKALYVCLFAMPVLGWLATDAANYPVEFFSWSLPQFINKDKELGARLYEMHEIVGWALAGLIAMHIGAAVFHWRVKRDTVMQRMTFGSGEPRQGG
jgi:cytochrome b561